MNQNGEWNDSEQIFAFEWLLLYMYRRLKKCDTNTLQNKDFLHTCNIGLKAVMSAFGFTDVITTSSDMSGGGAGNVPDGSMVIVPALLLPKECK